MHTYKKYQTKFKDIISKLKDLTESVIKDTGLTSEQKVKLLLEAKDLINQK